MKKLMLPIILFMMFLPIGVYANEIGEFYKDINVSLNCDKCIDENTMEIHLKLFANDIEVDGSELVLNKNNNFTTVFEDLPIFGEDKLTEINYDIRFLEDGEYRKFSNNDIKYNKVRKTQWVSVKPEDIVPGNNYVLMTDNWFYAYNGRNPYILLDGDMYHQYVDVYPEYKIVDGQISYYTLDTEPEERTIWHLEKLDSSDSLYNYYKDYWVLTNYKDEKLTLAGYMGDGSNSYFYKPSTKSGVIDYATYADRVNLIPIENELSRFNINSHAYWSEDHQTTLYLGIGSYVEVKAQREQEYGAHFIAFRSISNEEVEEVYNVQITRELCRTVQDKRTVSITEQLNLFSIFNDIPDDANINFKIVNPSILKLENGKIIPLKVGSTDVTFDYAYTSYKLNVQVYDNPNTGTGLYIIILVIVLMLSFCLYLIMKNRNDYIMK